MPREDVAGVANRRQHWNSPREEEVLRLRLAGFSECKNWQSNRTGPWSAQVVDALVKGQILGWRELCGHPRFLSELYHRQIEAWLEECTEVDGEYSYEEYKVPRLGRGAPSGRAATPCESFVDLYESYFMWCLDHQMEAIPERAFRLRLKEHLPGGYRFRNLTDETSVEPCLVRHVMGITLLS